MRGPLPVLRPIALGVMLALSGGAFANPTGPSVAAGAASFQSAGKTLSVTNAPGTIINWQSFSIGNGEHTRFLQQSASSAVLNRVVGADASSILGSLTSNGRVFLVNPHGIIFGAGARIDTAGFIASTLNMADRDFLEGRFRFEGGGNGLLRNEGEIRASGDIMLVGPAIENAGLIRSEAGSVLLAAGKSVTITSPDAQGVKFEVQAPTDSAVNLGTIEASSAAAMFAGTLVHSGDIRAQTASLDGGRVVLSAQKEAIVQSGGVISASGGKGGEVTVQSGDLTRVAGKIEAKGSEAQGGSVQLLGNRVGVQSGASVDASGETGGGTILVGGDYQGKNPEVQNAWRTYVAPDSTLRADAITSGDGGKVIVWADDSTRFHGEISARGGASGGDGGFVETSGKSLDIAGARVDTRAPAGDTGSWLLDPVNVQVQALGASSTLEDVNQFGDPGLLVIIDPATINGAASNVIIQAHNDIDFNDPVSMSGLGVGLTAEAGRSITVNASISTNNGEVRLTANQATTAGVDPLFRMGGAAGISMVAGTHINAGNADVVLRIASGTGHAGTSGDITVADLTGGNVSVIHDGPMGSVVLGGALNTATFNSAAATLSLTPTGALTISGANDSVFTGGTISNNGTINLAGSGALVLNTGAALNNTGNFVFQSDADVRNDVGAATFANTASVSKSGAAGTSQIGGGALTFTNTAGGTVDVFSGTLAFSPASFTTNEAAINVFSGTVSTGALTNAVGGNISIFPGANLAVAGDLTNAAGATISGAGTVTLTELGTPRTLTNFGTVDPGLSLGTPGTLNVDGNFTQAPGGTLVIDITTTAPGSFDVLAVSGHATLDGTLNVNHANGFIPPSDVNFNVITYGSMSGDFASLTVPAGYASFYAGVPGIASYTLAIGDIVNAWITPGSGAWETAGNWSLNHVPTAGEDVLIDVAAETSTITISAGNQFARRITSNENLTMSGGEIVFGPLASVVNAAFSVSGGDVTLTGELAANSIVLSGGSLDVRNSTGSLPRLAMTGGTLMSPGTLTVNGPFSASGGTIAPGEAPAALFVTAGASVITTANPTEPLTTPRNWSNTGTLTLGGELRLPSGNFTNAAGGTLNVNTGALMDLQVTSLTNNGTLNINTSDETPFGNMPGGNPIVNTGVLNKNAPDVVAGADFVNLMSPLSNSATGRINVNAGVLSVAFGGTQSGQIEIAQDAQLNTDGSLTNTAGGVIGGRGMINVFAGILTNEGSLRPGLIGSGGTLTVAGNYVNAPSGTLDVRLGGQAPAEFGSLSVTGTAILGGTLALSALPGYTAPEGDTFTFLTTGSIVNDFAAVTTTPVFVNGEYFLKQPTSHLLGLGGPNTNSWISDVSGAWDNASNWSRQIVPNSADARVFITRPADVQVTIPAGAFAVDTLQSRETVVLDGTLTLASASSVNGVLQINATGILQGAGSMTLTDLTLAGAIANTGGLAVTDSATLTGNSTIASGGRLTAQNDFLMLTGGTLNVATGAELVLTGGGDKRLGGGAVITNTGTTSLSGASLVGVGTLQNDGTLNSASAGGPNVIGAVFNNPGTVNVDGGTLRLTGDGTDVGTYAVDAGTTLDFGGGTRVLQGALALNGAGAIQLSGGTLDVRTGALPKLDMIGGTLTRTTAGDLTIAGAFNVSGGSVAPAAGAGLLITNGTTAVTQSVGVSRSWTNNGTLSIAGAGQINPSPGAGHQFVNEGTLDIAAANANPFGTAVDSSVVNRGTLNKTSAAVVDLIGAFNNTGVVNVDGGTLRLSGSGTDTGAYAVDAGTTLDLRAGTRNLSPGSSVTGAGTVAVTGAIVNLNGGYSAAATTVSSGTASFNGAPGQSTGTLSFAGGTLGGTGNLTVNTGGTWTGGELTGPVTLTLPNGAVLAITGDGAKVVNAATIANAGTVNLAGTGNLALNNGATLSNTGTFDAQSDADVQNTAGGATFANLGTLRKSAGTAITTLGTNAAFVVTSGPTSTIDVQAGTLQVNGAFPTNSGSLNVESGATFSTGGAALANAGTLRGAGTIDLAGATLTNNSVIAPGTATDNTGTLTIGGNLAQGAQGSVAIELGGTAPGFFDALSVSGSAALDGTLNLTTTGAYVPASGDTFNVVSAAARTGNFAITTKSFANEVVPTYGATSLSLLLGSTTGNTWIFDVSDSWTSPQRWSQGRAPIATDDVVINRAAGEFTITIPEGTFGALTLNSNENLTLLGTLALTGASAVNGTLALNGGTLQGAAPVTVTGTLALNGGTVANAGGVIVNGSTSVTGVVSQLTGTLTTDAFSMTSGGLTVAAGSTLNLVGAQPKAMSGGTLTTAGITNLSGTGDTTLSGGALWDNSGTVNLGGAARIVLAGDGAATLVNRGTGVINDTSTNETPIAIGAAARTGKSFMNAGRYTKAPGSADVQTLDVPMTNTGTIEVLVGTLIANGFPANSGIVDIRAGATFSTAGLPLTNSLFGLLKGDGTLMLAGATFTNNGTVAPGASPGTLTIDGNYVQGPGGTLAVELGGSVPGTDYDVLKVSGTAALDGTLVVTRSPGTIITEGSAYEFMTYASATGDFTGYSVPQGLAFQPARGPTSYTLTNSVAAPPEQVMEAIAVTQNESVVFNERVVVTRTADNTDPDAERRTLQECR